MPYKKNKIVACETFEYRCKCCKKLHIYDHHINNMFLSSLNEFKNDTSNLNHANSCPNFTLNK